MKRNSNPVRDFLYSVPIRFKLLLASVAIFLTTILVFGKFLDTYFEMELKEHFAASAQQTVDVISSQLIQDPSFSRIESVANLDFVDKVILQDRAGVVMREWGENSQQWENLFYFSINVYRGELERVIIAINRGKYSPVSSFDVGQLKAFTIYISALITLLVLLFVNVIIVSPIESVRNTVDTFIDREVDYGDDDKSRSQIIELSKTVGALKRSIAESKQKESELANIQMRLSSVLNTIGDTIITINHQGEIVMVNRAFERTWGHKRNDVVGENLEILMPGSYREAHNAGLARYLNSGSSKVLNKNLELEGLHADGHIFPIEINISETKMGEELFFTAAIRDITARKLTEQELLDAKQNVEEMLELRTMSLVNKVNELNCLYSLSTLIEKNSKNISHVLKETLNLIVRASRKPETMGCLIEFDGHEYKTKNFRPTDELFAIPIVIREQEEGHITLSRVDNTKQENLPEFAGYEEQLVQAICTRLASHLEHYMAERDLDNANQALRETQLQLIQAEKLDTIGTLAAGVAHEVKNPLAVIQLGVNYLARKAGDNDAINDVISEMDEAIHRADSVIKELVNFSASNELTLEALDVNQLLEDSLLLVKHEIIKNNVIIEKDFGEHLPLISADKQKLGQVIINLVINAIHAMEESERKIIRIRTLTRVMNDMDISITGKFQLDENLVIIDIEDTGTGIGEDKMDKLFDPFFTTKASGQGTGLGLTVCQNIIRLHGGSLKFSNSDEGGARARLIFHT